MKKLHGRKRSEKYSARKYLDVIQERYQIYAMRAKLGVDGELFLQSKDFYELNGRVFQPYGEGREVYYAYARPREERKWGETQSQYDMLSKAFVIKECTMGNDPQEILTEQINMELRQPVETPQWLTMHYLEKDLNMGILVGYYKSEQRSTMDYG